MTMYAMSMYAILYRPSRYRPYLHSYAGNDSVLYSTEGRTVVCSNGEPYTITNAIADGVR